MSRGRRWVAGGVVVIGVAAFLGLRERPAPASHAPAAAALGQVALGNPAHAPSVAFSAVARTAVAAPGDVDAGVPTSTIIDEIRAVLVEDPALAERLAREDQQRNPDSPDADERDALLVAAVNNQHDPWRARAEARIYFRRHRDGKWVDFLQKGTGASIPPLDSP